MLAFGRDGRDGAGGVVAAGGDEGNLRDTTFVGDILENRAKNGAGWDNRRKNFDGQMELLKQLKGPIAAAHVVHLAGGGAGKFGLALAGEKIVEQIGDEEEGVGDIERRRE